MMNKRDWEFDVITSTNISQGNIFMVLPSSDYWCNNSQMHNTGDFSIFLSRVGFTRSGEREANDSRHGEKTTRYDVTPSPNHDMPMFSVFCHLVFIWCLAISSFTRARHLSFGLPRFRFPSVISFSWPHLYLAFAHEETISTSSLGGIAPCFQMSTFLI